METSALAFLESPEARRLAAAWPIVGKKLPRRNGVSLSREWADVAGVRLDTAETRGEALRRSGICRPDGTLDPLATKLLASVAMATAGAKPTKAKA